MQNVYISIIYVLQDNICCTCNFPVTVSCSSVCFICFVQDREFPYIFPCFMLMVLIYPIPVTAETSFFELHFLAFLCI